MSGKLSPTEWIEVDFHAGNIAHTAVPHKTPASTKESVGHDNISVIVRVQTEA